MGRRTGRPLRAVPPGIRPAHALAPGLVLVAWQEAGSAALGRAFGCQTPTCCFWLPLHLKVWFDDPASLERKCALAAELGLRGVGMWHLDCLDYRCTDSTCRQGTEAMWAALRAFTGGAQVQIDDVA